MKFLIPLLRCVSASLFLCVSCSRSPKADYTVGLSMDTLEVERWKKDRDIFTAETKKLGGDVIALSAEEQDAKQISDIENLITRKVDVLVVIAHNGKALSGAVAGAKSAGIPVIAYDRLIMDSDVDLYISFDNVKVGRLQAQYLVDKVPAGNYLLLGGSPTDNNAGMFRAGQMEVLEPLVDAGKIKIIADPFCRDWKAAEALNHTENALSKWKGKIDAVVASNDGLAGGAIQALKEAGLAGKVPVSGQDAELAACRRILSGEQTMTVYKPIARIAAAAAQAAFALAKKHALPALNSKIPNGMKDVPFLQLEPVSVDKANLEATVIADGFHSAEALGLR